MPQPVRRDKVGALDRQYRCLHGIHPPGYEGTMFNILKYNKEYYASNKLSKNNCN